jgi:hypothetical protein
LTAGLLLATAVWTGCAGPPPDPTSGANGSSSVTAKTKPPTVDSRSAFCQLAQGIGDDDVRPLAYHQVRTTTAFTLDLSAGIERIGAMVTCAAAGPSWRVTFSADHGLSDQPSVWADCLDGEGGGGRGGHIPVPKSYGDQALATVTITDPGKPIFVMFYGAWAPASAPSDPLPDPCRPTSSDQSQFLRSDP